MASLLGLTATAFLHLVLAANPYLDDARRDYASMRYDAALERLKLARQVSSSTRAEQLEALDLLARTRAALGDMALAERAYEEALTLEPMLSPPENAAPKLRNAFLAAKRRVYPPPAVVLTPVSSTPERIETRVLDPWKSVTSVVLVSTEAGSNLTLPLERSEDGRTAAVSLPPGFSHPYALEARAQEGTVLARVEPTAPPLPPNAVALTPPPAPLPPAPVAHRPRVAEGILFGVAAAAAATSAFLALRSADDHTSAQTAHFASDTGKLNVHARNEAIGAYAAGGAAVVTGGIGAYILIRF